MIKPLQARISFWWTAAVVLSLLLESGCTAAGSSNSADGTPLQPASYNEAVLLGHLENKAIAEASGIAASRLVPGILWIVNDGGNPAMLYAVDMQGAHIGQVKIREARNVDWEDLAAYRSGDTAYLVIADFGDNRSRRRENLLYFLREPNTSELSGQPNYSVPWERRVRFVYEDGPRDCEAIAVDPDENLILLLTKRTVPPIIYALPLEPDTQPPVSIARRIATVEDLRPPANAPAVSDPRFEKYRSQPTAMDISPDGSEIAILTYGDGYLYQRPNHRNWSEVFRHPPKWIRMPSLRQAESLCFTADGMALIVTSERLPAPLYRLDRYWLSQKE